MARKISTADPALSIDFFVSGYFSYRSQLFAPFKNIGINVVSFRDPVLRGSNFELTDKLEWTRRPGFSIFCPIALADTEIVNEFYSTRNLNGIVNAFVDTSERVAVFTSTSLTTIFPKTTSNQGYIETVGNITFFADGTPADLYTWDGAIRAVWGLAAPTVLPSVTGMGFWQPNVSFALGTAIVDPNGSVDVVTAILLPNGAFASPTSATTLSLGGSLPLTWAYDSVRGGYSVTDGYNLVQQLNAFSPSGPLVVASFSRAFTVGNVVLVSFGLAVPLSSGSPSVVSVTDNVGNVYSVQAQGSGIYHGGGGQNYQSAEWIYSAPITMAGATTVEVLLNNFSQPFVVNLYEVAGINATVTTNNFNFISENNPTFDTGDVSFSGTQFTLSSLLIYSPGTATPPSGYMPGEYGNVGELQLQDAYYGATTAASPTWSLTGQGQTLGVTAVFPITTLNTGYTPYLFLYNFNLNIPLGVDIVGIAVTVPKQNAGSGTVQDYQVQLVIGGSATGTNEASATVWNPAGYFETIYGGPNVLWGLTPSAAQLIANGLSGFGIAISALIASTAGGSVVPEVGFISPNQPTVTVYYKQAGGVGGPGISGPTEPTWPTSLNGVVVDGGLVWTNYGPILTWLPVTAYPTPVIVLDANGNLQLSTYVANPISAWNAANDVAVGDVVYFGGQYWVALVAQSPATVVPSVGYATTGSDTITPYWALTTTPLVTGLIAPVWNTEVGGTTIDGSYTWTNIGQGTGLAFIGYAYVYGYRTVYGHLTTGSPFSANTGAILGPLNGAITSFEISANVVTFTGSNNFLPGNIFQVTGLSFGTYLNDQAFTVISAIPSSTFPLTAVETNGTIATITALNNLDPTLVAAGKIQVTFSGVMTAQWLNGVSFTVLSSGLSSTQFEIASTEGASGPTPDTGNVMVNGSWTASPLPATTTYPDTAPPNTPLLDSGAAIPLIATIAGVGTGSPLCNAMAAITAVSVTANVVTLTASNNFQPGIWVTITGLTGAAFLNGQQFQVIAVDQLVGTQNNWFQVYFETPNYATLPGPPAPDAGTATFNAIEIYRTSDGGGTYLFDGAVTNPGATPSGVGFPWTYQDFVVDANLDIELVAPLNHQNDPPPGAPGSSIITTGTLITYWKGRLWMAVGNYVYFDAGPDCTNGIPEQAWPPANRFQFAGPVFNLIPTADGVGLLVQLADRFAAILGGPETISFYPTDALSNFGISNPNAIFRDGSIIGLFTTQRQYFELLGEQKNEQGSHIADYLEENFAAAKTYVTMHRDGLDVGVFLSNGVDRVVRFGSNISAWSVPAFPAFGAGALRSIETSVGVTTLMLAIPQGGVSGAIGPFNPTSGISVGSGQSWITPENITLGNPTEYATATFTMTGSSAILRASGYPLPTIPAGAVITAITVSVVGKQTTGTTIPVTITPTNPVAGAESRVFSFGSTNTTVVVGGDLWGMPWSRPCGLAGKISFDLVADCTSLPSGGCGGSLSPTGLDNFMRPDENPLSQGGNWTVCTADYGDDIITAQLAVVGDKCVAPVPEAGFELYTGVTLPDNQYAKMTIGALSIEAEDVIYLLVRATVPVAPSYSGTGYWCLVSGEQVILLAGGFTGEVLGIFNGLVSSGDVIGVCADGDVITVTQNGTSIITATDDTATSGYAGLVFQTETEDSSYLTHFECGPLSSGSAMIWISEVQVTVAYQNPGNYLYARDLNSWGDGGVYGQNNGCPYAEANIVIGSITLSQPGALLFPLQHIIGYFDAVGTLNHGSSSQPQIWILPNEVNDTKGIGFVKLPEVLPEPPEGQNTPSASLLALRWPVVMANSDLMSQYIHHLQLLVQFEPENAPNTIKAVAFSESQN